MLEVGLTPDGREVIVNHPELIPDERGGHIVFSPSQAIAFAELLIKKAMECTE
jgi:hypothetical protein